MLRKVTLLAIAVVMLLSFCFAGIASAAAVVYEDSFDTTAEGKEPAGWSYYPANHEPSDEFKFVATEAYRYGTTGKGLAYFRNNHANGNALVKFPAISGNCSIEFMYAVFNPAAAASSRFRMMILQPNAANEGWPSVWENGIIYGQDNWTDSVNTGIYFRNTRTGEFGDTIPVGFELGKWYNIKYVFTPSTKSYDVFVDGVKILDAMPHNASVIDGFRVGNVDKVCPIHVIDNIKVVDLDAAAPAASATPAPAASAAPSASTAPAAPKTGDSSTVAIYMILAAMSAAAMIIAIRRKVNA